MRKLAKPVSYVKAFIFINIIFILSTFVNAKVIKCLQSILLTIKKHECKINHGIFKIYQKENL